MLRNSSHFPTADTLSRRRRRGEVLSWDLIDIKTSLQYIARRRQENRRVRDSIGFRVEKSYFIKFSVSISVQTRLNLLWCLLASCSRFDIISFGEMKCLIWRNVDEHGQNEAILWSLHCNTGRKEMRLDLFLMRYFYFIDYFTQINSNCSLYYGTYLSWAWLYLWGNKITPGRFVLRSNEVTNIRQVFTQIKGLVLHIAYFFSERRRKGTRLLMLGSNWKNDFSVPDLFIHAAVIVLQSACIFRKGPTQAFNLSRWLLGTQVESFIHPPQAVWHITLQWWWSNFYLSNSWQNDNSLINTNVFISWEGTREVAAPPTQATLLFWDSLNRYRYGWMMEKESSETFGVGGVVSCFVMVNIVHVCMHTKLAQFILLSAF